MEKKLTKSKAMEILIPVCRELTQLMDEGHITFITGEYNEKEKMYKIFLKSRKLHFASRGLKDSIGDIEYQKNNLRIGMRANNIPVNIYIELLKIEK